MDWLALWILLVFADADLDLVVLLASLFVPFPFVEFDVSFHATTSLLAISISLQSQHGGLCYFRGVLSLFESAKVLKLSFHLKIFISEASKVVFA